MSTFLFSAQELGMVGKALDYVAADFPAIVPDPDFLLARLARSNRDAYEALYAHHATTAREVRDAATELPDRENASDPWPLDDLGVDGPVRYLKALKALRYNTAEDPFARNRFGERSGDYAKRLDAAIAVLELEVTTTDD